MEESLNIYWKIGNRQGVHSELNNLGTIALATGDFAAAERYFVEALISARNLKDKRHISHSFDGFAYLAAQNGELGRAVRLSGAAEILRCSIGYEIEPSDRRLRDEYIARLKAALGESDFTTLFVLGQNLNLEDAVALCFSEESTGK